MSDSTVGVAATNIQNSATSYTTKPQRSNSVTSSDSGIALMGSDKVLAVENESTIVPLTSQSEEPEVESRQGEVLQIIDHDGMLLANSTHTLPEQYKQIHDALLLGVEVIEDTTKKLCEAFEADISLNPLKIENIKEGTGTAFCLAEEISGFTKLFPEIKKAIHVLETNFYSKDAFPDLYAVKAKLDTSKANIVKNLPPPQSKLFKYANYLLDGLGTMITLIVVAMAATGLATLSTTVPCAIAALICLIIKAWKEKTTLPEDNKNMYLKSLEEQYKKALNTLEKMEEDVFVVKAMEQNEKMIALQERQQEIAEQANQKFLQEMKATIARPILSDTSNRDLLVEFKKRLGSFKEEELRACCDTDEEFQTLMKLSQERTPSPDVPASFSREQTNPAALTGQA